MSGEPEITTARVDGTGLFYLGSLGGIEGLNYDDTMPGGSSSASFQLDYDPTRRHEAFSLGRRISVLKGGSVQWEGTLLEPQAGDGGWSITGNGAGNWGSNFNAVYTTWNATDAIDQAIARGLRWIRGATSGAFLGQQQDSGSIKITDFMNLMASPASQTWRVHRVQAGLQVDLITIPSNVTRLLICSAPAARTIAGYVNRLYARYQVTLDTGGTPATTALVNSAQAANIAAHDVLEDYWDLSDAGVMTGSAATALAAAALTKYDAASYAGPFTAQQGDYLTVGGVPVDNGCEHAGEVVQLILADGSYGGEVMPTPPITFPVGRVQFDAPSGSLSITPFQAWTGDLSNVLASLAPKAPA